MKIMHLKPCAEVMYAVFKIETDKERDFFNNMSEYGEILPQDVSRWIFGGTVPAAVQLFANDQVGVRVSSEYSWGIYGRADRARAFLTFLHKIEITDTNLYGELQEHVKRTMEFKKQNENPLTFQP